MYGGGNSARLLAQVAALVAELTASGTELPTPTENSVPRSALSTKEAAARLRVSVYTINEWARLGRIQCRQDSPRGPRYFYEHHLAAYEQEHDSARVAVPLAGAYSARHETRRTPHAPAATRTHTSRTGRSAPRDDEHGGPVGTGKTRHKPAGRGRPIAPAAAAWRDPKKPPEG